MKIINIGLVGLGSMGKIHFQNAIKLENVNIIGIADTSRSAFRYAKKYGVKELYNDYENLFKLKNMDAVIISLPNYLHSDCAIKAAESGLNIFIEKPLAINVNEANKILSSIRRNNVKFMIGYPMRFSTVHTQIKEQLKEDYFGKILMASATNIGSGPFGSRRDDLGPSPVPGWWFDTKLSGGGALLDLGCHLINLLVWYFGEIDEVTSYLGYRFNMQFEDHALSIMKFKNDVLASINVGWFAKKGMKKLDLSGTVRSMTYFSRVKGIKEYGIDAIKKILGRTELSSYYKELVYFIDSITSDYTPNPSIEEGIRDLRIIEEAYKNSRRFEN